ncbi:MAG TPA: hypothetical protein VIK06_05930 [Candidatus Limnocylindrales bacterium]|jgi:hypothetical protein
MTQTSESIVDDYMRRLEQCLAGLPPEVAKDVAAQVGEHIATALSAMSSPSESDVRNVLEEVGSPQSIARAAAVEFPSTHRVSLRTLAFWGYVLLFGALWGYATFGYTHQNLDGSTDTGMIYVWMVMGFVGSTLVGLKNRRIQNRRMRTRITLGDGAVIFGSLVLIAVLPGFIGMVKGLVLLALFTPYYYKTWHIYQAT